MTRRAMNRHSLGLLGDYKKRHRPPMEGVLSFVMIQCA